MFYLFYLSYLPVALDFICFIFTNPVSGKWKPVEDYREYPHSSAGFYELGKSCEIDILSYRDI